MRGAENFIRRGPTIAQKKKLLGGGRVNTTKRGKIANICILF